MIQFRACMCLSRPLFFAEIRTYRSPFKIQQQNNNNKNNNNNNSNNNNNKNNNDNNT